MNAMSSTKGTERMINIFSTIITLNDFDGGVKKVADHGDKGLKMSRNF